MQSILVAGLPFVILTILLSHVRLINALKLPCKYHHRVQIVCCHTSGEIPFNERFNIYLKNQSLPMPTPKSDAEAEYVKFELTALRAKEAFERQIISAKEAYEREKAFALEAFEREKKLLMDKIAFEEKRAYKWRGTVILVALILGGSISISIYYGAVNFGAAVITPKFREQLSCSWKELKKAISEIRIFRFG